MTSRKDNLSLFSEDLTSELRDILNLPTIAEQNNTEIQEIGRHIAQFVLLKESLGGFDPSAICKIRERWI